MHLETLAMPHRPPWLLATASLGAAWNVFGVVQFIRSLLQTQESLMASGMTAAQAAIFNGLPPWMSLAFAVGTFGGLVGSVLMGLRKPASRQILAVSFGSYVLLFMGDLRHGLFAAIPSHLAIMALVVLISAGLLWMAVRIHRRGAFA